MKVIEGRLGRDIIELRPRITTSRWREGGCQRAQRHGGGVLQYEASLGLGYESSEESE